MEYKQIYILLKEIMRKDTISRKTNETEITVELNLDGSGNSEISTGIGFLDHMLTLLARHSLIDMKIKAIGDLEVDFHHTVEDVGICIGQALTKALADKKGIARYGLGYAPMDETLTRCVIDISGRPYLVFKTNFQSQKVGEMDTELFKEFFQALAYQAGITMHIETFYGDNSHHIAESCFKGLALALKNAVSINGESIPSTKGVI